jgi:hypothetical protein
MRMRRSSKLVFIGVLIVTSYSGCTDGDRRTGVTAADAGEESGGLRPWEVSENRCNLDWQENREGRISEPGRLPIGSWGKIGPTQNAAARRTANEVQTTYSSSGASEDSYDVKRIVRLEKFEYEHPAVLQYQFWRFERKIGCTLVRSRRHDGTETDDTERSSVSERAESNWEELDEEISGGPSQDVGAPDADVEQSVDDRATKNWNELGSE